MTEQAEESTAAPELGIGLDLDHGRRVRTGIAEAVYAPGKTPAQCAAAVAELLARPETGPILLTRADPAQAAAAVADHPATTSIVVDSPGEEAALHTLVWRPDPPRSGTVPVVTAGTADLSVARDAAAVLTAYGLTAPVVPDVGVAGIHRVLAHTESLAAADVVIVVAGMEGALASVVGGLTPAPVIAVPTSVGYGASLDGVTALLAMLSSCSPGITVVGIDNGFGAGCAAVRILNTREEA